MLRAEEALMSSFVLVHGASHGAWCWERVIPWLEADARVEQVVALDLPGRAALRDVKPADEITLQDYVDHVVDELDRLALRDVVLVGHSLAGLTLPPVSHRVPERLRRLVYLASSNPPKGQTVMDLMTKPLSPISRGVSMEQMFCNDIDEETSQWLMSQLCDEPPLPMQTPVEITRPPKGVPSTYVLLEQDETLPPPYQREQAETAAVDEVVTFDSGHSAFAAKPRELAELLLRYA